VQVYIRARIKGDAEMRDREYLNKLIYRIDNRLENRETVRHIRAYIRFLKSEISSDYYAFKLDWRWMLKEGGKSK
jgi:hypothetical protein